MKRPVADDLAAYYRGVRIAVDLPVRHRGRARLDQPVRAGRLRRHTGAPYINNSSPYDAQAESLRVMLGSVEAPSTGKPGGTVTEFSQDPYAVPPSPGIGDVTKTGATAIGVGST